MSIFRRIFRYRPTANRLPQEDFFTEAFVGVLEASDALREEFVRRLTGHDVDSVAIATQRKMAEGRIDIWIEARARGRADRHLIAMENKIGAPEGADQLERYARHLMCESEAATKTLVYATPHERRELELPSGDNGIRFCSIQWSQVADWLRAWSRGRGREDEGVAFVRELLLLMEEWKMAMNLSASDLAAATAYHNNVRAQLLGVLDDVWAACDLPGTATNKWNYQRDKLCYASPFFNEEDEYSTWVYFGFDFGRDEPEWSVARLNLPSAYFAVMGHERAELDGLPKEWTRPPEHWADDYVRVRQIACLHASRDSMHQAYLDFFLEAQVQVWRAFGR